jgi:MFS family permease
VILVMATVSAACSLTFGWLIGTSLALVVGVGLLYGFAALRDSAIYSTAITEVVAPAYRGSALALRSLLGYGAGAVAPLIFGATLDRLLHGTPEASALHRGSALPASAISEVAR